MHKPKRNSINSINSIQIKIENIWKITHASVVGTIDYIARKILYWKPQIAMSYTLLSLQKDFLFSRKCLEQREIFVRKTLRYLGLREGQKLSTGVILREPFPQTHPFQELFLICLCCFLTETRIMALVVLKLISLFSSNCAWL